MKDIFVFKKDLGILIFLRVKAETIISNCKSNKSINKIVREYEGVRSATTVSNNNEALTIAIKNDKGINMYSINKTTFDIEYKGGRNFVMA